MGSDPTFWLRANAPASVFQKYLDTEGTGLVALYFMNCLVADPEELARLATRCEKLRVLNCIATRMKAADLLSLMLGPVQQLTHLEFSMVDETDEANLQLVEVIKLSGGELTEAVAKNLRILYIEIVGDANFDLLEMFLERCPSVTKLHVHLMGGCFVNGILRCSKILDNQPFMETFMFTSEVPPPELPEPPRELQFRHYAAVCGNVLYRRQPRPWNIAVLGDLATSTERVHLSEPLTVFTARQPNLDEQIRQACLLNNWSNVRTFCLVMRAPMDVGEVPGAGITCAAALLELFQGFRSLTELNVNSFHFHQSLDLTELLDPIPNIQALSLPPCGLMHDGAFQRLALKCRRLEDLDVRSGCDGWARACDRCLQRIDLDPAGMAELSVSRSDGRLTLSVPMVSSLAFAASCQLAELRIFDHSEHPLQDYRRLGHLLSNNRRLRVLVLKYKGLNFGDPDFKVFTMQN
ncbi:hypothetical protein V5799_021800 [Amblyomma americanum]|uniref:Uncharacterized protein n=1 Tax=Amblyomma americanum TaxID=6943 RepID=A0AAQ4FMC4_AMBAM